MSYVTQTARFPLLKSDNYMEHKVSCAYTALLNTRREIIKTSAREVSNFARIYLRKTLVIDHF